MRGPETQRREDRDFAGARDSETGGQRLRERQRKVRFGDVVLGEPLRPSSCLRPPDYDERSHLHDAFTQMTHSLQEVAAAQGEWGGAGSGGRCGLGAPGRWMFVRGKPRT